VGLAVIGLLTLHYALAARSLLGENPTVDEVVHLPAGVTYWQKGTFILYHHNPPLVKLVAALPVVIWARPDLELLYRSPIWRTSDPSQTTFSQYFASQTIDRYFELFQIARLMMPLFSIVGGLTVFAWSRRLYGVWGGLLSLALWSFCPNILAHARLITTDLGSTALGVTATYLFWRYLEKPSWRWAALAGFALGLAELTKFSMVLLYAVWPFLWLVRLWLVVPRGERLTGIVRTLIHGIVIVGLSVVTIDAGYFFEEVGIPLGQYEFGSRTLTRPVTDPFVERPNSKNPLLDAAWQFRENRFRGTWLERLRSPLPEHYLLGFDEQKIEAEGIPIRFQRAAAAGKGQVAKERARPEGSGDERGAYPVYLNGQLRRTGWWYYYLLALVYKVPEGTWLLVGLAVAILAIVRRSRASWANEIALWSMPLVILVSMSFFTDINLGLRYVLPIAPYVFIATGKVAPWVLGLSRWGKRVMGSLVVGSLGLTIAACIGIHPSYLAYFNWASGGPDRVPARLIDSNLDWGQDLVGLQEWCKKHIPGQPIGLVYFGQINPSIFGMRSDPFPWFLPPARPGTLQAMPGKRSRTLVPAKRLAPGYYAVSATLLYGLPWRLYDSADPITTPEAWSPAWNAWEFDAFRYFQQFEPIEKIGHSIYIYHLNENDLAKAAPFLHE
jgi:4-amino-4-deoxy-L-arabinose transferase-like glycosyltransferase